MIDKELVDETRRRRKIGVLGWAAVPCQVETSSRLLFFFSSHASYQLGFGLVVPFRARTARSSRTDGRETCRAVKRADQVSLQTVTEMAKGAITQQPATAESRAIRCFFLDSLVQLCP